MLWIIDHQLGRRNITPYQRGELQVKRKPLLAAEGKEKQREGGKKKVLATLPKAHTRERMAKAANVSDGTMKKIETIVAKAPESVKAKLRKGDMTINKAYKQIANVERKEKRIAETRDVITIISNKLLANT